MYVNIYIYIKLNFLFSYAQTYITKTATWRAIISAKAYTVAMVVIGTMVSLTRMVDNSGNVDKMRVWFMAVRPCLKWTRGNLSRLLLSLLLMMEPTLETLSISVDRQLSPGRLGPGKIGTADKIKVRSGLYCLLSQFFLSAIVWGPNCRCSVDIRHIYVQQK